MLIIKPRTERILKLTNILTMQNSFISLQPSKCLLNTDILFLSLALNRFGYIRSRVSKETVNIYQEAQVSDEIVMKAAV